MLNNRTGTFVPRYFSGSRQSLNVGQSYPVKVHGAFQYQDGTDASVLILIELESTGELLEANPSEVVMNRDEGKV